jgi:hypothetical protein
VSFFLPMTGTWQMPLNPQGSPSILQVVFSDWLFQGPQVIGWPDGLISPPVMFMPPAKKTLLLPA